jgi:2',3'-cyclic-nucleotide 2'-phosphodiesterase/3'-nucleotidase
MRARTGIWIGVLAAALAARAETVQIRVLATTDLHGNIYPYDYYAAQPAPRGLAKIATLIAKERAANPNTILVDCGDTIQGAPLEGVHQADVRAGKNSPDPMMLAMNHLGYDAMTVGNHEFNFGMKNLEAARAVAKFPFLAANIEGWPGVRPYLIKTVAGVRVAIVGITTPAVPAWEKEENYRGLRFTDAVEAVKKSVAAIQAQQAVDVVVVAAHAGLDRDPKTGARNQQDLPNENTVYQIGSQAPGIDAIIFGHTHSEVGEYRIGDVLLMQPRNWGMSLGEMDIELERGGVGWKVVSKSSRVIPVTNATPADPALLSMARPYHEAAERYLDKPVAQSPVAMSAALARVEDTPLIDAIQMVQLDATKADVSFASAFNVGVRVPQGNVTVRQIAALYLYDNTLYAIEGNGKMVRDALENSARFYLSCTADCSHPPLINKDSIGYNYDMAQGIDYEIDLRQPVGRRIVNLKWKGRPLSDDQPLRIAVNSYRAGGSAGYTMFAGAKVVWRSSDDIREMMIQYFAAKGVLPAKADGNWRVIPGAAQEELRREARRGSSALVQ